LNMRSQLSLSAFKISLLIFVFHDLI
jgi:hypothetical protein